MDEEYAPQIRPTHRLELRVRGLMNNIREGPYISHNYIVSHIHFLRKVNDEDGRPYNVCRILPIGGTFNTRGDVLALLVWYLMLVYAAVAIPLACFCETTSINIGNLIVLAIMCVYHLTAIYLIFSNMKKLQALWCTTKTTAEKYIGLQNYFMDITKDNTKEIHCVTPKQKKQIVQKMTNRKSNQVVLMLITSSYMRSRRRDPVLCLGLLAVLCLVGIVVQLETLRVVMHDR